MSTFIYDHLLDEVLTVDDVHLITHEIDLLMVHLYKADKQIFLTALDTTLQRNLADALMASLTEQEVSLDNHTQVQQYFVGLKDYLTRLPIVQLTLAYHPTTDHLQQFTAWLRQETSKPIVLHINYNKDILGGAIITFEGRYVDLSLKKKIEAVYETKQEQIMAVLK